MRVKQIENMFSLMEFFVRAGKPLTQREIVEEFAWPRSSAFNVVSTLVELGYLYQPVPRGGFSPTSKWMELAKDLANSQPLPEAIHELLVELMIDTGETVILAGAEGVNVVFLDVVESNQVVKFTASVGERSPIHITSLGRAILSQYTSSERTATLKRINYGSSVEGPFKTPAAVEENIRKSMKRGWFANVAEEQGLAGIGVPFPYRGRRNAIAVGAPTSRVKKRLKEVGEQLRDSVNDFLKAHGEL